MPLLFFTMETVFDYNIDKKEKEAIGVDLISKDDYLNLSDDTKYLHLAYLFSNRGNIHKAKYYANKLPIQLKNDCLRTINHK